MPPAQVKVGLQTMELAPQHCTRSHHNVVRVYLKTKAAAQPDLADVFTLHSAGLSVSGVIEVMVNRQEADMAGTGER